MKNKLLTITLVLMMSLLVLVSCGKKETGDTTSTEPVATNSPKVTSDDLKDFFPFAEGVKLVYTHTDTSKTITATVKSMYDNSITVSHNNKESVIKFSNEGIELDNDFILKLPLEKNASWDSSKGKVTVLNTNYILDTMLGNISTIEVSVEGGNTYYIARNLGIVKIKYKDEKTLELTSISSPSVSTEKPEEPKETAEYTASKLYYYDAMEDAVVYITSNTKVTEKTAPKFFEGKFKNPPSDKVGKLMPSTTKIKSIKVDKAKSTVTMDVSEIFTESMNLGSGSEMGVLQGIANTLGNTYDCKNVVITANGKSFITGHSEISAKDPLTTNLTDAKELK